MHPDSCARHNNRRINNSTIIKRLELVPKLTSARARTANDKHECIRTNTQRTRSFLTLFSDCFWHHLLVSRNCFTITDDLRICAFISWLALLAHSYSHGTLRNHHFIRTDNRLAVCIRDICLPSILPSFLPSFMFLFSFHALLV